MNCSLEPLLPNPESQSSFLVARLESIALPWMWLWNWEFPAAAGVRAAVSLKMAGFQTAIH